MNRFSESFQSLQPAREETARAEYDRLVELKLQRNEKLQTVGANHPTIQKLDESIRELSTFVSARQKELNEMALSEKIDVPNLMVAYKRLLSLDLAELDRRRGPAADERGGAGVDEAVVERRAVGPDAAAEAVAPNRSTTPLWNV
ncbi:MAG: hypothetical protein R3C05_13775 [Pirellulaceae bacterium]